MDTDGRKRIYEQHIKDKIDYWLKGGTTGNVTMANKGHDTSQEPPGQKGTGVNGSNRKKSNDRIQK